MDTQSLPTPVCHYDYLRVKYPASGFFCMAGPLVSPFTDVSTRYSTYSLVLKCHCAQHQLVGIFPNLYHGLVPDLSLRAQLYTLPTV